MKTLFHFEPNRSLWILFGFVVIAILTNYVADLTRGTFWFHFLYQGVFVLGISIFLPLWFTALYKKFPLSEIGISQKKWLKAVLVGVVISTLAIVGRLQGLDFVMPASSFVLIVIGCMFMSTLFEEVFFRGFLQTGFERQFGMIPAIVLSAVCFSLYHLGYSNIRADVTQLMSLFAIGVFFSISFRITNNIITSYIVNLPQAVFTFIAEPESLAYSKNFDMISALISVLTLIVALVIIVRIKSKVGESKLEPS